MTCYIISYDLVKERDYEKLYQAIKSYKWAQITESTWAIVTTDKAKKIGDDLLRYIDSNDRLFVINSGGEASWRNILCDSQWLKDNL